MMLQRLYVKKKQLLMKILNKAVTVEIFKYVDADG